MYIYYNEIIILLHFDDVDFKIDSVEYIAMILSKRHSLKTW